jgi:beta-lactamase class C
MKKHIKYIYPVVVIIFILLLAFRSSTEPICNIEEEDKILLPPTKQELAIQKFDSLFTIELDSSGIVGAAVAIVDNNHIYLLKCYGVKEAGSNDSIDENTLFRLASVSKAVTGVLAGMLLNDSIINLDDKVTDYLPGFVLKDSINTADLTIRHILSHTSGLVPHAYDNLAEAKVPFSVIMDSLKRVNISAKPGELYGYQNVVFSLIDTIACVETQKTFDDIIHERLFQPFGMPNASTGFLAFKENQNIACPHVRTTYGYRPINLNDRLYNTIPAAGINASIYDMAMLLQNLLKYNSVNGQINYLDTVFSEQVYTPLSWKYFRKWDKVQSRHYGLGWRLVGYKNHKIAYHGGYVRGYRAEVAFCKEENIGIVYLSNSPNGLASLSIPMFLNMFFDTINDEEQKIASIRLGYTLNDGSQF